MSGGKNYVYTDLSTRQSLVLEVEGLGLFDVVQFSASWAVNEIPVATVMLAVGRDVRTRRAAAAHDPAFVAGLRQMQKACVWFRPTGEAGRRGRWPGRSCRVFDGYVAGVGYRKLGGKVQLTVSLVHWLAALTFSSALTKLGHVANPALLNVAAVLPMGRWSTVQDAVRGVYLSALGPAQILSGEAFREDFWRAVKTVFCALAGVPAVTPGPPPRCGGGGDFQVNDVALRALGRIEGPSPLCPVPYKHGVPLRMKTDNVSAVTDAVASAVGGVLVDAFASVTFWDKLVGEICPMFGLAVVPTVESAVVVADVPAYRKGHWKEIGPDEYDSCELVRELHYPLRAVGVLATFEGLVGAGMAADGRQAQLVGGCYAEDSVAPGDGVVLYVPAPPWLKSVAALPQDGSGTRDGRPGDTATTPGAAVPGAGDTTALPLTGLYNRYAQAVYVNHMLRGHYGTVSGRLRFDIAPASVVRLAPSGERLLPAADDGLVVPMYGCVQRVTVTVNAESGVAGTAFQLSHVRTEDENARPRTSADAHPLFGDSIHGNGRHGCPLVDDFDP